MFPALENLNSEDLQAIRNWPVQKEFLLPGVLSACRPLSGQKYWGMIKQVRGSL